MSDRYFSRMVAVIKKRVPDFQIKFKDEDPLMKFLCVLLFFLKFSKTITTFGKTVYFPSRAVLEEDPDKYFPTLCHEYVHVLDYVENPIKFMLGYLFPQELAIFSLFSILALLNPYFFLFLICLLFLTPIPAPFRTRTELRGYGMSCKVAAWQNKDPDYTNFIKERSIGSFTSATYYFMCPFVNYVSKELDYWVLTDECLNDPNKAYADVYRFLNENI